MPSLPAGTSMGKLEVAAPVKMELSADGPPATPPPLPGLSVAVVALALASEAVLVVVLALGRGEGESEGVGVPDVSSVGVEVSTVGVKMSPDGTAVSAGSTEVSAAGTSWGSVTAVPVPPPMVIVSAAVEQTGNNDTSKNTIRGKVKPKILPSSRINSILFPPRVCFLKDFITILILSVGDHPPHFQKPLQRRLLALFEGQTKTPLFRFDSFCHDVVLVIYCTSFMVSSFN